MLFPRLLTQQTSEAMHIQGRASAHASAHTEYCVIAPFAVISIQRGDE